MTLTNKPTYEWRGPSVTPVRLPPLHRLFGFGLAPNNLHEYPEDWLPPLNTLKQFFESTPSAAVGEVNVFRQQLELAKELKKPASILCVRAFGDLLQIMKPSGPFPAGVILHSYVGSAEMVPEFAILAPSEKILLEIDAPDALPKSDIGSLHLIEGDASLLEELQLQEISSAPTASARDASTLTKAALNHPVLIYVASLLEMTKGLSEISYHNALRLFPYYVRT